MVPVRRQARSEKTSLAATLIASAATAGILGTFAAATYLLATAPVTPAAVSLAAQADALAAGLQQEVGAALALAAPLRARLHAGEPVDWKSFEASVAEGTLRRAARELVVWAPRVSAAGRAAVEADSGRDAFRSWNIVETGAQGAPVPAQPRAFHYPIALAAPLGPGSELLGLDLGGTPELEAALAAGAGPSVVGPLTLLPPAACADRRRLGCTPQIFVVIPVLAPSHQPAAPQARRDSSSARGVVLVGLSWAAITDGARDRIGAGRVERRSLDFPRNRSARATFRVLDEAWTIDLMAPPGSALSARLGHAAAVRGN